MEKKLKGIELITIKKGSHEVVFTYENGHEAKIPFSNKYQAQKYVKHIKNYIETNPNNREQEVEVITDAVFSFTQYNNDLLTNKNKKKRKK